MTVDPRRRNLAIGIGVALVAVALLVWWLASRDGDGDGRGDGGGGGSAGGGRGKATGSVGADPGAVSAGRSAGVQLSAPITLLGRVVDESGAPIAGAAVRGSAADNTEAAAVSAADGTFALHGLPAGDVWLRAARDDARVHTQVFLVAGLDPVTLRLERGLTATITVVEPDGTPIAGATVAEEGDPPILTDARGEVHVRGLIPPYAGFNISADGFAPAWHGFGVARDRGGHIRYIVVLRRGAALSGVVLDAQGRAVAGAEVYADRLDDAWTGSVTAGLDGTWRFPTLAAGTLVLTAGAEGHASNPPVTVVLDGIHPATVELRLGGGAPVAGRVVDEAGEPVAGAAVVVVATGGKRSRATSDAAGAFHIAAVGLGSITATATAGDRASAPTDVAVEAGGVADLELVVVGGTIAGVVVDPSGRPIEGVMVSAKSGPSEASTDTDPAGRFVLRPLAAGSYRVEAIRSLGQVEDVSVEATTGATDVRLVLAGTGTLTGVVMLDGAPVTDYYVGMSQFAAVAYGDMVGSHTADGRFTQKVAAGRYVVVVAGDGFATKELEGIELADGATVDVGVIAVERGGVVRGRVVDAAGAPVAGALVRSGVHMMLIDDASDEPGSAAARGLRRTRSGADGRFTLTAINPAERDLAVEAEHPAHGRSRRVPVTAATRDVELVLAATGALAGTVVGATKSYHLFIRAGRDGFTSVSTTDDGRFEVAGLAPGRYEVRNFVGPDDPPEPAVDAVITGGKTTWIEIVRGTPVTLVIAVKSCRMLYVYEAGGQEASPIAMKPCPDGVTTIPFAVAPGTYEVCADTGCTQVTAAATPARQQVDLTNPVP
jgi:protocatechuate 3,4-dioxygenase beta subunit